MSLIVWIALGLVSGFVANQVATKMGEGPVLNLVLGVVGAVVAGYLFTLVGPGRATGLTFWSVFLAFAGAVLVLSVKHAVAARGQARA
jgi:uncharacterized membrane protein YeaQ/YmgE (transglycosylase-associated protein family)